MNNTMRFAHIDALRGIAALFVIWLHTSEVFVTLSPETQALGTALYDAAWAVDVGRSGVVVFFSISGFVICRSLSGEIIEGSKRFLIKRILRLFPAFWVSILLSLFSMWWLFDRPFDPRIVLANITMLPSVFGVQAVSGLYWTLETELVFYTLCWLVFLANWLNKPLVLFSLSALLALVFVLYIKVFSPREALRSALNMPYHLAIMFWGGLFRFWYDQKKSCVVIAERKIDLHWLLCALTGIIVMPALAALLKGFIRQDQDLIRMGSSYVLGLSVFIIGSLFFRVKNQLIVWVGTISYSLYLFHPVILYSLLWYLRKHAPPVFLSLHVAVYVCFTLIFSIALSAVIFYLIEKPAIVFSHKVINRRGCVKI